MKEYNLLKENSLNHGYIVGKNGQICKKSVLEKYYEKGYLFVENSKFSDEDRLNVGKRLARDYYFGNYNSLQSIKLNPVNIRTSGTFEREEALFYKDRYLKAIKSIPIEFWPSVRRVCIEDLEFKINNTMASSLINKNKIYHQKCLLALGLERLIYFYLKKCKKNT